MGGPIDDGTSRMTTPRATLPLSAWMEPVAAMRLTRCTVTATPRRAGALDSPLGAVVRGLLGARLRELRCATGAPTCDGCAEAPRCDHHRLFERADQATETRAFWLQGVSFAPGLTAAQPFTARLVTWAAHDPALPHLEAAFRDALARVGDVHRPPNALSPTVRDVVACVDEATVSARRVTLHARTPLSLRGDPDAARALCPGAVALGMLLRAGVRRLDALLRVTGVSPTPPRVAWPDLTGVRAVHDSWVDWEGSRVTHRHDRRQPLSGVVGALTVEGDAVPTVIPLLRALSRSGVGRHTAYGFGELHVEV